MAKDMPNTRAEAPAKPEWAWTRREIIADWRARNGLPPRRRWPWMLLVLLVLAGVAAFAARDRLMALVPAPAAGDATAEEVAPAEPLQINSREWAVVEPATLRRTVRVLGPLAPVRRAEIAAETGGRVDSVPLRPGDAVAQGDVVIQVDVERLTLELAAAESNRDATRAQLELAEAQLERSEALVERGVAPATTLDEVRTNVAGLRANLAVQEEQVRLAELALERATVTAPFDGVVASRSVEPGAVVGAGTPLLSIVDLSRVEMLGAAPVAEGASIRPGQAVDVRVDGVPGRSFAGEVVRIAPVAEEGTRTLTVFVGIDNAEGLLLGGMFATGEIVLEERPDALAVPGAALREDAEGTFVLVIEEGIVLRRPVEPGPSWPGGLVEIVAGLSPGDRVVTAPLDLEPGAPVRLVDF